ncbi:MAG: DUF2169 domain-containing protein [Roseiarcus sp.]
MPFREQPPILLQDVFYGEPNASSLRRQSDLAPGRLATDVTFEAIARAPEGKLLPSWPVAVMIGGRAAAAFEVRGPAHWEPTGLRSRNWRLSDPARVSEIPVRYEFAYGGSALDAEGKEAYFEFNPVGRGYLGAMSPQGRTREAPQLGLAADFANAAPQKPWTVVGLGPVGRAWLPRRIEAGTFDDAWKRERWPRMPADYSLGYWNCAPPSLRFSPWLRGDETVRAVGLRHDPRPYEFTLPGARAACLMARNDGLRSEELPLALQSVHIDIASADSSLHRVSLTWGASFPSPEGIAKLEVILEDGFKAKRGFHGQ